MKATLPDFRAELDQLRSHYDELARCHGYGPQAVHQSSVETQEQRLRVLAALVKDPGASVLDFGCGTGHLLQVLQREFGFRGSYTGYDLSGELLKLGQARHPAANFEQRDIFEHGVGGHFDHVLVSGVFNNRLGDNWGFLSQALQALYPHARRGLAFNALSAYVDYQDEALYYADPERVFRFCKEQLSPAVNLWHGYEVKAGIVPFEFTIEVLRCPHVPRAKQPS